LSSSANRVWRSASHSRSDASGAVKPPHLPGAVETAALRVDPADLDQQPLIAERPCSGILPPLLVSPIRRRGDLQGAADRLDPEPVAVLIDERHQLFGERGSS